MDRQPAESEISSNQEMNESKEGPCTSSPIPHTQEMLNWSLPQQVQASPNTTSEISFAKKDISFEESIRVFHFEQEYKKILCGDMPEAKLRELNERLLKTIQSLQRENHKLKYKVEYLTKKVEVKNRVGRDQERIHINEEIELLKNQNSVLNQMIVELQTRLDMQIKMRTEAEKRITAFLNEARSPQIQNLVKYIEKLEKEIASLKIEEIKNIEERNIIIEKERFGNAGDAVDGIGMEFWNLLTKMKNDLTAIVKRMITSVKEACDYDMREWEKTVREKQRELTYYYENHSGHIKECLRQIHSLTAKIQEMEKLRQDELLKSQEIIKVSEEKLMAIKSVFHHEFSKTDVLLQAEIITYDNYLAVLEGRLKSDNFPDGDKEDLESLIKKQPGCVLNPCFKQKPDSPEDDVPKSDPKGDNENDNKGLPGSPGNVAHNPLLKKSGLPEDDVPKSDPKGDNENDNKVCEGLPGSPGNVAHNQGWDGTKDWSEHFEQRQTFQNPDLTEDEEPKRDPEADNEKDNQVL